MFFSGKVTPNAQPKPLTRDCQLGDFVVHTTNKGAIHRLGVIKAWEGNIAVLDWDGVDTRITVAATPCDANDQDANAAG